jgi:hypothetical protein
LAVENLTHPWSVLANGVANSLLEALNIRSWPASESIRDQLPRLRGLFNDLGAKSNLSAFVDLLERGISANDEENLTPRPRRFQEKPATPTHALVSSQLVELASNSVHPNAAHKVKFREDPPKTTPTAESEGQSTRLFKISILSLLGSLTFFGWWTLNRAWETLQTPISNFTLLILAAACVPTLTTLTRGFPLKGNMPKWYRGFLIHSVAQILLGSELWLCGPSTATLGFIVLTIPSVLGMVAYVCLFRFKRP